VSKRRLGQFRMPSRVEIRPERPPGAVRLQVAVVDVDPGLGGEVCKI